jgi:hypothetical protein
VLRWLTAGFQRAEVFHQMLSLTPDDEQGKISYCDDLLDRAFNETQEAGQESCRKIYFLKYVHDWR